MTILGEFSLIMNGIGPNRLKVMAFVRDIRKLRLVEAKSFCTELPCVVAEGTWQDMRRLELALQTMGSNVSLKPSQGDSVYRKELVASVALKLIGGRASPRPPVGPALRPYRLNVGQFVAEFNERTTKWDGDPVDAVVRIFSDRSFTFAEIRKRELQD